LLVKNYIAPPTVKQSHTHTKVTDSLYLFKPHPHVTATLVEIIYTNSSTKSHPFS